MSYELRLMLYSIKSRNIKYKYNFTHLSFNYLVFIDFLNKELGSKLIINN